MPSTIVLSRRFVLDLRAALRLCRGGLRSMCAGFCGSVAAFVLGLRSALRLCRGALPLVCARPYDSVAALCPRFARGLAILLGRFASVHACCLSCDKQDGLRCVAFLFRRVEIAIRAFSRCWCGYLPWLVHFGFVRLFVAISTGLRRDVERGERGWRQGASGSLRNHIGSVSLSAGSTLGLNVEAALRSPQTAPKSQKWKPHCGLSGLSSGAGRAAKYALRGALPSVHACLFSFIRKKETACDRFRFYSAGSRSPFVRSRGVGVVICLGWFTSGLCVYLWRSRRGYGETWNAGNGAGGKALVGLCATTSAL